MGIQFTWADFWSFYEQAPPIDQKELLEQLKVDSVSTHTRAIILKYAPQKVKQKYNRNEGMTVKQAEKILRELNRRHAR